MSLSDLLEMLRYDLARSAQVLGRGRLAVLLAAPGFQALALYRLRRWLGEGRGPLLAALDLIIGRLAQILTGADLSPRAKIGPGLVIGHAVGVVIGEGAVIGRDGVILHGVTLGIAGRGPQRGYPSIGDRVYVGAGAKVLGKIQLGDDVVVGANAVVTRPAPGRAVLAGVPARIISYAGSAELIGLPAQQEEPANVAHSAAD